MSVSGGGGGSGGDRSASWVQGFDNEENQPCGGAGGQAGGSGGEADEVERNGEAIHHPGFDGFDGGAGGAVATRYTPTIIHTYTYAASGAVITETCAGCQHEATATLTAPESLAYDGISKEASVSFSDGWSGSREYSITYQKDGQSVDVPVEAGIYTASVILEGKTAEVTFEIAKSDSSLSANDISGTYGDSVQLAVAITATGGRSRELGTVEFTCDGTSLGSAAVVSSETGYSAVLTYDTTKKGLTIGANTVTAVYSGGDSLNGEETRFTVTVSPKALSVTGVNTTDRDYNAANYEDYSIVVTLTGSEKTELEITGVEAATGLVYSGQAQVGYTGTPSAVGYSGEFEITYSSDPIHAGEYTVTISIPESDVQFTGSVNLRFTIEPKPLTVAALDRNVYVGGKAPDLSAPAADADYTVEGLLGTDSLGGVVTMEYQKDGAAVTPNTAVPGSYAIVISCAGANPDYQVTCSNDLLTISPRPGSGTTTYNVNVADTAHGDVTASPKRASKSATVTVTTVPDEGYELAKLVVTDVHGNLVSFDDKGAGVFTFKMPGSEVTVTAVFRLRSAACAGGAGCPLRAFTDLTPTAWYHDGIHYCLANGLMDGVGNSRFAPDAAMSRAMVWTILARIHGETISGENWIDTARAWAMAEGVSDGTDANGHVTREQFVTMLWRFAGEPASSFSLAAFTDAASVSSWAETAMRWVIEKGIIQGVTGTTIVPQGSATRAQTATIIMRFCENLAP